MADLFALLNAQHFDDFRTALTVVATTRSKALEVENDEGDTILARATQHAPRYVTACLDAGCDPYERLGDHGDTALTWCARDGRPDAFRVLAAWARTNDRDPHEVNEEGNAPLHIACVYGNAPMVRAILEFHPDLSVPDSAGETVTDLLNTDRVNDRSEVKALIAQHAAQTALTAAVRKHRL